MPASTVPLTNVHVYPRSITTDQVINQDLAVPNSQGQIDYDHDIPNVGIRNVLSVQVDSLFSPPNRRYKVIATKQGNQVEYPHAVYFGHKSANSIELDLLDH